MPMTVQQKKAAKAQIAKCIADVFRFSPRLLSDQDAGLIEVRHTHPENSVLLVIHQDAGPVYFEIKVKETI